MLSNRGRVWLCVVVYGTGLMICPASATAQKPPAASTPQAASSATTPPELASPVEAIETPQSATPAQDAQQSQAGRAIKRKAAQQAILTVLLLLALLVVGLFLVLVWMARWSRKTYHLLHKPLPSAPRGDELWFLKKQPPATKSPPSE